MHVILHICMLKTDLHVLIYAKDTCKYIRIHIYTYRYAVLCTLEIIQHRYILIQSNTCRYIQNHFAAYPRVKCMYLHVFVHIMCICCAYVVHIFVLYCMYVHICAYMYVSMRLALLEAKNTCTYAHTCTYSSSYIHIHL
jgi:hypothetical protein